MNPNKSSYKDAVFISAHKFVGGPGAPGLLIAKKDLLTHEKALELQVETQRRSVAGVVRCGLAFRIKSLLNAEFVKAREEEIVDVFKTIVCRCPNFIILSKDGPPRRLILKEFTSLLLGDFKVPRLSVFSFVIAHPMTKKLLHYNFIGQLLNDFFGIQSRNGQLCAAPYIFNLLGISEEMAVKIARLQGTLTCGVGDSYDADLSLNENKKFKKWKDLGPIAFECDYRGPCAVYKPGVSRLSLPYFIDDQTLQFVADAVEFVAEEGWKLIPLYTMNVQTGSWTYENYICKNINLADIKEEKPALEFITNRCKRLSVKNHKQMINAARAKAKQMVQGASTMKINNAEEDHPELCWFVTPNDALKSLTGSDKQVHVKPDECLKVFQRITLSETSCRSEME
ncbi:hypothetical protein ACOME3_002482 [Neoechinorhynchus agilis]